MRIEMPYQRVRCKYPLDHLQRARAKKFKEALIGLIQDLWADSNCKMGSNNNLGLLNLIQADDGPFQA